MLTALLICPVSDSHQYTPLSQKRSMLHVNPFIFPKEEQGYTVLGSVNIFTLHSVEFPSQLSDRDSLLKCCNLSGLTVRDAAR